MVREVRGKGKEIRAKVREIRRSQLYFGKFGEYRALDNFPPPAFARSCDGLFPYRVFTKLYRPLFQRVASRRNKYFYNPIEGTPFSLALALPEGYGMYEAVGEEEIKRSPVNCE